MSSFWIRNPAYFTYSMTIHPEMIGQMTTRLTPEVPFSVEDFAHWQLESFNNGDRFVLTPDIVEAKISLEGINNFKPDMAILTYVTVTPGRGPGAQAQRLYEGLHASLEKHGVPLITIEPTTQTNGYHAELPNVRGHVNMDMDPSQTPHEQIAVAHERTTTVYKEIFDDVAQKWIDTNGNQPLHIAIVDVGYDGMTEFAVKRAVEFVKDTYGLDIFIKIATVDSSYDSGNIPSLETMNGYPVDVSNPTSFDKTDNVTCIRVAVNSSATDVYTYLDSPTADTHSIFAAAGHPIPGKDAEHLYSLREMSAFDAKQKLKQIYAEKKVSQQIIDLIDTSKIINIEMNNQYLDNKNHLGRKVQSDDQHIDVNETSRNLLTGLMNIGIGEYNGIPDSSPILVLSPTRYLEMAKELGGVELDDMVIFQSESDAPPVIFIERQAVKPAEMGILFRASDFIISRTTQMNADAEAKLAGVPVLDINMPGHNFMWSTSADREYGEQGGLSYNAREKTVVGGEVIWEYRPDPAEYAMAIMNLLYSDEVREGVVDHQDKVTLHAYDDKSGTNVYNVLTYLFNLQ